MTGESVLRVPNLVVPSTTDGLTAAEALKSSAVQLFVEKAAAVVEDFELSNDNVAAVASVCRQVDGVPLAIELAVPRLRVMQPEWLAGSGRWRAVRAVREGRLLAVESDLFNRPGPRVAEAARVLAEVLHGEMIP